MFGLEDSQTLRSRGVPLAVVTSERAPASERSYVRVGLHEVLLDSIAARLEYMTVGSRPAVCKKG
jgi:hypothetical protein